MLKAVVKIGGSLAKGGTLPELCRDMGDIGLAHPVLIIPGGGGFADTVRSYHARFPLNDSTAHWMAILGMDQFGLLLANLIPDAISVTSLSQARQAASENRIPILLPSAMLRKHDPLPHSWGVTSDSIAAWIAHHAKINLCVLLKSTDGLLDPSSSIPLPHMTLTELATCQGVDRYLPKILSNSPLTLWALDGRHPARLATLLATGHAQGTRVPPVTA